MRGIFGRAVRISLRTWDQGDCHNVSTYRGRRKSTRILCRTRTSAREPYVSLIDCFEIIFFAYKNEFHIQGYDITWYNPTRGESTQAPPTLARSIRGNRLPLQARSHRNAMARTATHNCVLHHCLQAHTSMDPVGHCGDMSNFVITITNLGNIIGFDSGTSNGITTDSYYGSNFQAFNFSECTSVPSPSPRQPPPPPLPPPPPPAPPLSVID